MHRRIQLARRLKEETWWCLDLNHQRLKELFGLIVVYMRENG